MPRYPYITHLKAVSLTLLYRGFKRGIERWSRDIDGSEEVEARKSLQRRKRCQWKRREIQDQHEMEDDDERELQNRIRMGGGYNYLYSLR